MSRRVGAVWIIMIWFWFYPRTSIRRTLRNCDTNYVCKSENKNNAALNWIIDHAAFDSISKFRFAVANTESWLNVCGSIIDCSQYSSKKKTVSSHRIAWPLQVAGSYVMHHSCKLYIPFCFTRRDNYVYGWLLTVCIGMHCIDRWLQSAIILFLKIFEKWSTYENIWNNLTNMQSNEGKLCLGQWLKG